MPFLQDIIHKVEFGGSKVFRIVVTVLALLGALFLYDWRAFRNMASLEAMDAAQLARNIAQGNGYNTLFVRPFSIYLLERHEAAAHGIGAEFAFKYPTAARLNQRLADETDKSPTSTNTVPVATQGSLDGTHNFSISTNTAVPVVTQTPSNTPKAASTPLTSPLPPKLQGMHPDLANPPVYPVVLAGLMKVLPFRYQIPEKSTRFWTRNGLFARYQPDFLIALFNQLLFYAIVVAVFFLARRLFDATVAWLSSALLLGTELLWRFSVSGLSTMLLILIFTGLVWCLVLFETEAREPKREPGALVGFAIVAGLVTGLGALTRYAFGWMIIPVLIYVLLFSGPRRASLALIMLAAFAAVIAPWIARNYHLTGTPFGTAGYAVLEDTFLFGEHKLQRSLDPDLTHIYVPIYWYKLISNLRVIVQSDLPKLAGSWFSAFFLAGLLVSFRSVALKRLRVFLLLSLGVLAIVQALGRTQLSEDVPEINSENLLILLAPLVIVYGVSFFITLLDQMNLPALEFRFLLMVVSSLIACLPIFLVFLPPRPSPLAFPPYMPPVVQTVSGWVNHEELIMSDVPWAVAWYGHKQSVWLTLKSVPERDDPFTHEDFFSINDYMKPISVLYLTPQTMDSRFLTQWVMAGERSWGRFILEALVNKEVPKHFPLYKMQRGWLPAHAMLADRERWSSETSKNSPKGDTKP